MASRRLPNWSDAGVQLWPSATRSVLERPAPSHLNDALAFVLLGASRRPDSNRRAWPQAPGAGGRGVPKTLCRGWLLLLCVCYFDATTMFLCTFFSFIQILRLHGFSKHENACTLSRKQGKHHENPFSYKSLEMLWRELDSTFSHFSKLRCTTFSHHSSRQDAIGDRKVSEIGLSRYFFLIRPLF